MTRRFRELWQKAVLTIQLVKVPRSVTQVSFNTSTGWYMIMTSWSSLGVTNKRLLDVISSLALGAHGKRWVFFAVQCPTSVCMVTSLMSSSKAARISSNLGALLDFWNDYPLQTLPCIHPICSKTLHSPILFEKVTNLADIFKQVISQIVISTRNFQWFTCHQSTELDTFSSRYDRSTEALGVIGWMLQCWMFDRPKSPNRMHQTSCIIVMCIVTYSNWESKFTIPDKWPLTHTSTTKRTSRQISRLRRDKMEDTSTQSGRQIQTITPKARPPRQSCRQTETKGRRRPKEAKTATKPARQKAMADKRKQRKRQRKHTHQSSETTEGRQKADTATHAAVVVAVG